MYFKALYDYVLILLGLFIIGVSLNLGWDFGDYFGTAFGVFVLIAATRAWD